MMHSKAARLCFYSMTAIVAFSATHFLLRAANCRSIAIDLIMIWPSVRVLFVNVLLLV